ncbi:MAG: hypothetical protein H7A51_00925 [Akkermansiaceae bacterium]|nr:hypothetical protein [Akkermansiaceae bacterium]
MEELLKKITSYNILNNLLPGVVLVAAFPDSEISKFCTSNSFFGAIICYVTGVVVSRIGSLLLEPALKKIAKHEPYADFIAASTKDPKIAELSETNNTFRTLASTGICYMAIVGMSAADSNWSLLSTYPVTTKIVCAALLSGLFVFSYRKQTDYICKRVRAACDSEKV